MNDILFDGIGRLDAEVIQERLQDGMLRSGRSAGMLQSLISAALAQGLLFTLCSQSSPSILGYLAATVRNGWLHIEEVAVDREFRRNGIATALVDLAIKETKNRSLRGVTLITDRFLPENIDFFKTLGFAEFAECDDNYPVFLRLLAVEDAKYFLDPTRRVILRRLDSDVVPENWKGC